MTCMTLCQRLQSVAQNRISSRLPRRRLLRSQPAAQPVPVRVRAAPLAAGEPAARDRPGARRLLLRPVLRAPRLRRQGLHAARQSAPAQPDGRSLGVPLVLTALARAQGPRPLCDALVDARPAQALRRGVAAAQALRAASHRGGRRALSPRPRRRRARLRRLASRCRAAWAARSASRCACAWRGRMMAECGSRAFESTAHLMATVASSPLLSASPGPWCQPLRRRRRAEPSGPLHARHGGSPWLARRRRAPISVRPAEARAAETSNPCVRHVLRVRGLRS